MISIPGPRMTIGDHPRGDHRACAVNSALTAMANAVRVGDDLLQRLG
jgi:hypothetical protein